ncbi:MAG: hypothetical protein L6Q47_11045 [Ignavibacteriaceae bacterium]|nr:hypothetical protein [Ignavibacteriaceae bacterium]
MEFKNRKRNRLQGFDYSSHQLYFITAVTNGRVHDFGYIRNGVMELSEFGTIAEKQWDWLLSQYPYLESHAFVVMPNHIHAVIEIISDYYTKQRSEGKIKPLTQIIGAYKTTTSKLIHQAGRSDFQWQRSFHDHMIRNEKSYEEIVNYIETNPLRWADDKYSKMAEDDES